MYPGITRRQPWGISKSRTKRYNQTTSIISLLASMRFKQIMLLTTSPKMPEDQPEENGIDVQRRFKQRKNE
ncbi:hypothetical protein BDW66DRAFT_102964 [Aspergillus desertorum]